MKKVFKYFSVLLLALICFSSFGSEKASAACKHSWNSGTITKAATCTATGVRTYKCTKCNTTKTETISKKSHTMGWVTVVQPTCTKVGRRDYRCTVCGGATQNSTSIDKTPHSWNSGTVTKAATCSTTGVKTYKCTKCGTTKTETIAKKAHTMGWVTVVQPTCTKAGRRDYRCTVCGGATQNSTSIDKTPHSWNSGTVTKAATCVATGVKTYTCSVCKGTKTETIAKTAHKWNSGVVTKAATCSATGVKTYTCSVCKGTKTETIDKLAHTMGWVTVVQPTCTAAGRRDYRCTVCGGATQNSTSIDKTPHSWNSGVVTKAATCSATGVKTYTCSVCKGTKTEKIASPAHTMGWVTVVQPTCTASGRRDYKCTVCGTVQKSETLTAPGHKWNSGAVTKAATCSATGVKTYTCSVCKGTKTETIAKLAHTMGWVTVVQPTCTKAGRRDYRCTVCGGATQDSKTIDMIPHSYDSGKITKNPTCGEKGIKTYTCKVCSGTKTESVPLTGKHTISDTPVVTNPTCYADGKREWYCTVCGIAVQGETIQRVAHNLGIRNKVDSSCTKEGSQERYCKNEKCTYSYKEVIPKKEHVYDKGTYVMQKPNCTEEGYSYAYCKCGAYTTVDIIPALGHTYYQKEAIVENGRTNSEKHRKYCSTCKTWFEEKHTPVLYHLEGTDTDAYFCVDSEGNPCGCCSLAQDCDYDMNARKVYHRILPLKNGDSEYQQKVVDTCKNCGTVRTKIYAVKTAKPTNNNYSNAGLSKTVFNSLKSMIIDDVKGLVGDKFVAFTVADNIHTLACDVYDYLSKCGVNGDKLPFHQITDKEQLEMVEMILMCNEESATSYNYSNSKINIEFKSGSQSAAFYYGFCNQVYMFD